MASYQVATAILRANPPPPGGPPGTGANVPPAALAIRNKHGFGLNWEQEVAKNVGMFSRVGWNDGHEEAWTYTDANWTASLGVSVKGAVCHRPNDTFGLAGIVSGASHDQQEFLEAGGLGILNGDGALSYSPEKVLETYYNFQLEKSFQLMLDYQFVADPAFNSAGVPYRFSRRESIGSIRLPRLAQTRISSLCITFGQIVAGTVQCQFRVVEIHHCVS